MTDNSTTESYLHYAGRVSWWVLDGLALLFLFWLPWPHLNRISQAIQRHYVNP
jgi:hypothetical protein